jgi:hypothetical protein
MWKHVHVKYPLLLSDFNENWVFSADFLKNPKNLIWSKSVQWESSCSRRTDGHEEANSRFRQFSNAPWNPATDYFTVLTQQSVYRLTRTTTYRILGSQLLTHQRYNSELSWQQFKCLQHIEKKCAWGCGSDPHASKYRSVTAHFEKWNKFLVVYKLGNFLIIWANMKFSTTAIYLFGWLEDWLAECYVNWLNNWLIELFAFIYFFIFLCTRWFKYDRDKLWLVYTQSVTVIFGPPCICWLVGW